jgi:hypothetical protein
MTILFLVAISAVAAMAAPAAQNAPVQAQYTGPGSCSSTACHGSVQPRSDTRVWQNEYSIWVVQDKHAKAFNVLSNPQSLRIAKNLGLEQKPEAAKQCLACHALDVAPSQRARTFDLTDGVSCESCHGPAAGWLGEHTRRDWTHAQSVQRGMYDTKDIVKRQENCLSCHLGAADQQVNHELLAAGHPVLTFELDSYTAVMPRHWKEPLDKDPWRGVRDWSVGQAIELREAMAQLARRTRTGEWPEYAELDCYSCHHALTRPEDSWRQQAGYQGRRPGTPPWDPAQYAVLRLVASETGDAFDSDVKRVAALMSQLSPDKDKVNAAATQAAQSMGAVVQRLKSMPYDRAITLRQLRKISAEAGPLSAMGERTAEQTVMAMDSLFVAYSANEHPANEAQVKAAITALFQQLETPSAYNPSRFAEGVRRVGQAVGEK